MWTRHAHGGRFEASHLPPLWVQGAVLLTPEQIQRLRDEAPVVRSCCPCLYDVYKWYEVPELGVELVECTRCGYTQLYHHGALWREMFRSIENLN